MVLASAVLHSAWNYMAKRSADKLPFLWLAIAAGLVVFTPAFILVVRDNPVPPAGWIFIGLSSVIHVLYFVLLGGAYSRTDLSVVYPLARGTGPIFVLVLSVVVLREVPSLPGLLGILAVVSGVYLIQASALTVSALGAPLRALVSSGSRWALLTGMTYRAVFNYRQRRRPARAPACIHVSVVGWNDRSHGPLDGRSNP